MSIHEKDRREGGVESTEVMKGSQKSEDTLGLKELACNWRASSLPWASPVCLSVPIGVLGVKFPLGGVPARGIGRPGPWGVAVTQSLLSLFII